MSGPKEILRIVTDTYICVLCQGLPCKISITRFVSDQSAKPYDCIVNAAYHDAEWKQYFKNNEEPVT